MDSMLGFKEFIVESSMPKSKAHQERRFVKLLGGGEHEEGDNEARIAHDVFKNTFVGVQPSKVYDVTRRGPKKRIMTNLGVKETPNERDHPHDVIFLHNGKPHGISLKLGAETWGNYTRNVFRGHDEDLHEKLNAHWDNAYGKAQKIKQRLVPGSKQTKTDLKRVVRLTKRDGSYPSPIQRRRERAEHGAAEIHTDHFNGLSLEDKRAHLRHLLEKDDTIPFSVLSTKTETMRPYRDMPFHGQLSNATDIKATRVGTTITFTNHDGEQIATAQHRTTHFPSGPQVNIKLPE